MVSGDRLNDGHHHTSEDRPPPDVVDLRTTGAAFAKGRLSSLGHGVDQKSKEAAIGDRLRGRVEFVRAHEPR
jgi:hypothetical protein